MSWSFSIGHLFGSDVRIHVTFLILLAWVGLAAYDSGGAPAAAWQLAFILTLFACVLAHEFGHALMARRFGIATPSVTLLPFGGLARLDRMPERPADEIAVALAGPAVNIVIWAVLSLVFGARADMSFLSDPSATVDLPGFLGAIAVINLTLALFNMVPAFPMDGGRVLRAVLTMKMGRARGTEMAAMIGRVLAIGLGLLGIYAGNPILILIAGFVFLAASSESADVAMRTVAGRYTARDAMITEYHALHPDDTLAAATQAVLRTTQHEFPVTDPQGRAVGFVSRQAIFRELSGEDRDQRAGDLMQTGLAQISAATPLAKVMERMAAAPNDPVLVTGPGGKLLGYITQENLGELMVIAHAHQG